MAAIKPKLSDFPLGHFAPDMLARLLPEECAMIGALVMAGGQFDRQLCNLFSRLLGFPYLKPPDRRAEAVFYSSVNAKARRDAMVALVKQVDDELCREWLTTAIEKASDAADKRNNIIHSEYFADLENLAAGGHMLRNKPAAKKSQIRRDGIRHQIKDALIALDEAQFYMEFAFAATQGRKNLDQALTLYEPALRERRERQHPHSKQPDSR